MRRFFGFLLKFLIVLAVGLASALTAMRFAIHGREVAVPKFISLAPAQAEQLAQSQGLLLSRDEHFYSRDIPEGRVMSQSPEPGTKVRRGWRVRVAESLGPQRVTIPSVVGQSERAAEINLRRRGLEIGSVSSVTIPGAAGEQVVSQSPPANAQGLSSPKVDLLMASSADEQREYVMPDLAGAKLAEASIAVTDAGLKVGNVRTVADPALIAVSSLSANVNTLPKPKQVGEAFVLHQSPAPGQKVTAGMVVNFDVVRR